MAMGRVREHEVGGGARLLATALSSGVLLVGILGWMVAVGTMASPGGRFGENVLAPSAAYPSLGAAASDAGAYGSRAGVGAVGVSRGRPNDALDDTNVRRRNRPGGGVRGGSRADASGARPRTDHEARGRKHAWLAEHGAAATRPFDVLRPAGDDDWDLGSVTTGDVRGRRLLESVSSGDVTPDFDWSARSFHVWARTSHRRRASGPGGKARRHGRRLSADAARRMTTKVDPAAAGCGTTPRSWTRRRSIGPGAVKRRWCASSSTRPR